MIVTDIFSWVREHELSLEQAEQIFTEHYFGGCNAEYSVCMKTPDCASENNLMCERELRGEGKKTAYILKDGIIIAIVAYKD